MAGSRIPTLNRESIEDAELQAVFEYADKYSTPKAAWYLTMAHNPEIAKAYAEFWNLTHRGGIVEHNIKELMRIAIAQILDCDFCADQRSILAVETGLDEEVATVCSLPSFDHPDERTRTALRYARVLALDDVDEESFDQAYNGLRNVFSHAEIIELGCFAAIAIGGVKLSRSLRIE